MRILRSSRYGIGRFVAVVEEDSLGWQCTDGTLVSEWQTYDAGERGNDFKVEIGAEDLMEMIGCLVSATDSESLQLLENISASLLAQMHSRIRKDVEAIEKVESEAYEVEQRLEREVEATKYIATHLWHKANGDNSWGTCTWHLDPRSLGPEWRSVKKRLAPSIRSNAKKIETGG